MVVVSVATGFSNGEVMETGFTRLEHLAHSAVEQTAPGLIPLYEMRPGVGNDEVTRMREVFLPRCRQCVILDRAERP